MQTALTSTVFALPEDTDAATALTIQKMSEQISAGAGSAEVRGRALDILNRARVQAFDFRGAARAIYEWVRRCIIFTPDPVGKEGVQTAEWTLYFRRGDCDCISVLMCSLLESVGLRCRLMTIAADARLPSQYSHVYPEVCLNGQWVTVDAARRSPAFGKAPRRYFRRRGWSVHSDESRDFAMLGIMPPVAVVPRLARGAGVPLYYNPPPPRKSFYRAARGLRGLGQDWTDIGQAIQAGTAGAANIIAATRANPYNLIPTTYVPSSGSAAGPQIRYTSPVPPAGAGFLGLTTGELVVGALLLGVGIMAARR